MHWSLNRKYILLLKGVTLIEIAPGVDLENDILSHMEFKPHIAENLCEMDKRLFEEAPMGLTLTE